MSVSDHYTDDFPIPSELPAQMLSSARGTKGIPWEKNQEKLAVGEQKGQH